MTEEVYRSVAAQATAQIKVEGSRFIADLFPAEDEEQARTFLEQVRKRYFDATHHCYAYILGPGGSPFRYSDDGEPNGTAGVKIHSALQAHGLSDTIAVVTRYFGGTKLGVGGLGRAYHEAAEAGIAAAPVLTKAQVRELEITFPFSETNPVMNHITSHRLRIAGTAYTDDRTIVTLHLLPSHLEPTITALTNATRGAAVMKHGPFRTVVWK